MAVHQGLSKMKRNHIHFAPDIPGGQEIISGMLCVYVNTIQLTYNLFLYYHRYETQLSNFDIY